MTGRRRGAPSGPRRGMEPPAGAARRQTRQSSRNTRSSTQSAAVPGIYHEMLAEAGVLSSSSRMTSDGPERPLKRPRTGRRPAEIAAAEAASLEKSHAVAADNDDDEEDEDLDIEFEDVEIPKPTVQTAYLSSEEESDEEEDIQFEDVDIDALASKHEETGESSSSGTLHLNLTAAQEALTPSKRNRKPPLTKEEKERRVWIHQTHILGLMAHVEKRNHWCNDQVVQTTLQSLLPAKTVQYLNPGPELPQFGQTESIKRGLQSAIDVFRDKFVQTEAGIRRALWAEDPEDLQEYQPPRNLDSCFDKADFRKAALSLKGSRDVGAQLFCALMRAVGVEARLVCSLQPLSFISGGPTLPKPRPVETPTRPTPARPQPPTTPQSSSASRPSARSRLGHPNAAAYNLPNISPPPARTPQRVAPAKILESDYPVYWTEILDTGHQKWRPVDALVTGTQFRPQRLEPPASDRGNTMTYVVAFEDDGAAKDVTRRYAKAFNSKTRRMRIDGPLVPSSVQGAKWWRRALKRYKGPLTDLDQIENTELMAIEAREPMPRNVADFKDHPIYALRRHLRRSEVLVPGARVVGTVGASSKGALEKIYRRSDVKLARSADKWYRMGRLIKPGEEPVKVLPRRKIARRKGRLHLKNEEAEDESSEEDPILGPDPAKGNPLFTFDQTEVYTPPPVVAGRIPKNKFGNIDAYVPSMIPPGGVHIKHPRAGHAAYVLGVDYAPALQGFEFKGRKGTAVYNGVVVPVEALDAIHAVLKGFEDLETQMQEEARRRRALETWRNWLRTLRIRRRLFEGDEYWGDTELGDVEIPGDLGSEDGREVEGDGHVLDDGSEGGGFEPGGFEPGGFEPEGFEPGGFEPGGFEPGGFEPNGHDEGGSMIEPQPDIRSRDKSKSNVPSSNPSPAGGFDGVDETPRPMKEGHGLDAGADVDVQMVDSDAGHRADEPTKEDHTVQPSTADEVGFAKMAITENPTQANPDLPSAKTDTHSKDENEHEDDEEELGDAESDVTEELFMDEDGHLLE